MCAADNGERDRPELTDEMVSAGVKALRVDPDALVFSPEEIVYDVYVAMAAVAPPRTLA
jgi:hypothetical protein